MARLNYFVVTFDNRGVGTTKIHGIEPFRQRVASGEEKIMPNLEFLYAGNFENDKKHGYGSMEKRDGTRYSGSWMDDKRLWAKRAPSSPMAVDSAAHTNPVAKWGGEKTVK